MIEKFNHIKQKFLSKSIYELWKSKTCKLIDANLKEQTARNHFRMKLLKNSLTNWLNYLKEKKRKKNLVSKANSFLEMRIKTEYLFKWTCSYTKNMNMLHKNQQALMFWSINIQRTCFAAWFEWYKYKKQKKHCYDEALKTRQIDILKVCAKNFLTYAMDSKLRRLNAMKLFKERESDSLSNLELKYFNIWYQKIKKNAKSKHECSPSQLQLNKKVTLEKVEKINDTDHPQIKMDKINKIRTAPRKPTFLLDSIDIKTREENKQEIMSQLQVNKKEDQFGAKIVDCEKESLLEKRDTTENYFVQKQTTIEPNILLPPSAFAVPLSFTYQTDLIEVVKQPSTSIESKSNYANSAQVLSNKTESKRGDAKQHETRKSELELVELKKRLELLYEKSEKLK